MSSETTSGNHNALLHVPGEAPVPAEEGGKFLFDADVLSRLPEDLRQSFSLLSNTTREEIFQILHGQISDRNNVFDDDSAQGDTRKPSLKELLVGPTEDDFINIMRIADREQREKFMSDYVSELFHWCGLTAYRGSLDAQNVGKEVKRLMNIIWDNRGKKAKDMQIFRQNFYDEFFIERETLLDKLTEVSTKIEREEKRIENNKRYRREKGQLVSYSTILQGLYNDRVSFRGQLDDLDEKNDNTKTDAIYMKDVQSRMRKERLWMSASAIAAGYFPALDFAVIFSEQLKAGVLYRQVNLSEGKFMGRAVSEEVANKAKVFLRTVSDAIQEWTDEHQYEEALYSQTDADSQKNRMKLIKYFARLIKSYTGERGKSESETLSVERYMEVALKMLQKLDRPK